MRSSGLKQALERLGLRQAELARLIDVSPRTVSQWATGAQAVPAAVSGYLRLLECAEPNVRDTELQRLVDRGRQLEEGIYRVSYRALSDDRASYALAVLRNGKIAGSDSIGGRFGGSYRFDRQRRASNVHLRIELPPHGILAGGYRAGSQGALIEASCWVVREDPVSRAMLTLGGAPIEIELSFVGPLPN